MPFPTYKKLEDIPEAFRGEYEEREGEFHAKADGELATEKRKRAALLDEKKAEEKKRQDAEKERDDLKRTADAKAKGISEEELQKIRDAEALARKPLEAELEQAKAENRKLKLTDRVQALALKYGVMQDRLKQAMKILDPRTDLSDAGGIVVLDEEGKVTTETIDNFLEKTFKKESPWFYKGTGAKGSVDANSTAETEVPEAKQATAAAQAATVRGSF